MTCSCDQLRKLVTKEHMGRMSLKPWFGFPINLGLLHSYYLIRPIIIIIIIMQLLYY